DKTWFDMAGDFHIDSLHVIEKYRLVDRDTIQYEATIEDAKTFTKPWTIRMPLHRHRDRDRILEYHCQAEAEEANGAFARDARTWYPGTNDPVVPFAAASSPRAAPRQAPAAAGTISRT